MGYRLESVNNSSYDIDKFISFQKKIYINYPNWVTPIYSEVRFILGEKNPFWNHAEKKLFLLYDEKNCICGRIAGIIDYSHNRIHSDKTGFFGFFECINDDKASSMLFDGVKEWLKSNGMDMMRGPVNPSMNDECGFLLEGYDKLPSLMMPYTPPYYLWLCDKYGFVKAKDLYALLKNLSDGIPDRIERMVNNIKKRTGVKIRKLDMKNFKRDIDILKDIYNSAWEKNWGFVPMTDDEMNLSAKNLKSFVDPNIVLFAEINGENIGVAVTIPDITPVIKKMNGRLGPVEMLKFLYYKGRVKGIRSMIGGVKKEYRNTGIIAALYYETEKNARERGYEWCELGWNLEDNDLINRFDMAIGGRIYKKYRIFEISV